LKWKKDGSKALSVHGVHLKPQSQEYIDLIAEGYLSALLSPDEVRLLVSLGDIDEKNVWVVNLKTSQLEFTSHENVGRHLFPKWRDVNSFDLV
jgi:hypothetical protein